MSIAAYQNPLAYGTPALGELGASIARNFSAYVSPLRRSIALGTTEAQTQLNELYSTANEPNWAGHTSDPILATTFTYAHAFLDALPTGTPKPSIGAEPDGHITFEWSDGPYRVLSLSMSPEKVLHYAALLGVSKRYGTEPFFEEIPPAILSLIAEVMRGS